MGQKVRKYLTEQRNSALRIGSETRVGAIEADDEQVDVLEVANDLDHVLDVVHVLLVAAGVRQALGVNEAHAETVWFAEKAALLHRRQLSLGHGAVADFEQVVVLSEHVHERALAHAGVA